MQHWFQTWRRCTHNKIHTLPCFTPPCFRLYFFLQMFPFSSQNLPLHFLKMLEQFPSVLRLHQTLLDSLLSLLVEVSQDDSFTILTSLMDFGCSFPNLQVLGTVNHWVLWCQEPSLPRHSLLVQMECFLKM